MALSSIGHGSVINMNAANPQGLESTAQWVIFALSGTIYLFYLTLVLLLAFRKWHKLYLLVVALVAGTVHQVGFFLDLIRIMKHGSLGDSNRSDAFHAGQFSGTMARSSVASCRGGRLRLLPVGPRY
jgi:hypothetical protein